MQNQTENPPRSDNGNVAAQAEQDILDGEPLTTEERSQISEIAANLDASGCAETTIRGRRILIVGHMHGSRHLALAVLARMAEEGITLADGPGQEIAGLDRLEAQMVKLRAPEPIPVLVAEPYVEEDRRGKKRKDWHSPFGPANLKQRKSQQPMRNIKKMMRRPGGR